MPGGPGGGTDGVPSGDARYEDKPGLGWPKALVPFSLPVRVSDNDMVNTHTLKVVPSSNCVTPPNGTEPVCFPEVADGSFVPIDPEEIAKEFCGHPEADPATCCDPEDHEGDPNCEDLKGLYGNLTGTPHACESTPPCPGPSPSTPWGMVTAVVTGPSCM